MLQYSDGRVNICCETTLKTLDRKFRLIETFSWHILVTLMPSENSPEYRRWPCHSVTIYLQQDDELFKMKTSWLYSSVVNSIH